MEKHEYNLSEQLDHIAYMFNVRTKGKAYENFIVNAIYAKVGNPNLVPVTQQYVRNPNDPRKYYLLDLYFKQLNYGVEIDEGHHLSEAQKSLDLVREEDIRTAIECEEDRIAFYSPTGEKRSYEDVLADIDRIVLKIQTLIAAKGALKWETNEDKKKEAIAKGRFSTKDDVYYNSITEIFNICGGKRTGDGTGNDVKQLRRCYYRLNDKYKLWVPILAIEENGVIRKGKTGFTNTLSPDHSILTERGQTPWKYPLKDINYKRVVFMRMRDQFGRPCIRFIGVFRQTTESGDMLRRIYRLDADEVEIETLR